MPACLPALLPPSPLLACSPAWLPPILHVCLLACLSAFSLSRLPAWAPSCVCLCDWWFHGGPPTSHRKKRLRQLKKMMQRGLLDADKEDPFALFMASTAIRYCYYSETHRILGSTYGMCVLQVRERHALSGCLGGIAGQPRYWPSTLVHYLTAAWCTV